MGFQVFILQKLVKILPPDLNQEENIVISQFWIKGVNIYNWS